MQIKFEPKKLKEANEYVDLLEPKKRKKRGNKKKKRSFFQKIFDFLF